ncbi:MAG: hypothetical protein O6909_02890 [Alphaproteobacteria bacterium]|nr:hypothetical protein [Alphaproteobacteria bacterium]
MVVRPYEQCIDYLDEQGKLLRVSIRGTSILRGAPRLIEVLNKVNLQDLNEENEGQMEEAETKLRLAKTDAEFARQQIDSGFPILFSNSIIGIWGALERLISDIFVAHLRNHPHLLEMQPFSRVRLSISDFHRMTELERYRYIFREIERNTKATNHPGIARFESMLDILGLAGRTNKQIRRNLLELYYVRNLLVHRGGIVDQQFIDNCPWKRVRSGNKLPLRHRDYKRYMKSADEYIARLVRRDQGKMKSSNPRKKSKN